MGNKQEKIHLCHFTKKIKKRKRKNHIKIMAHLGTYGGKTKKQVKKLKTDMEKCMDRMMNKKGMSKKEAHQVCKM